eukprot:225026-Pleurochrysis_carterae.AAC.1
MHPCSRRRDAEARRRNGQTPREVARRKAPCWAHQRGQARPRPHGRPPFSAPSKANSTCQYTNGSRAQFAPRRRNRKTRKAPPKQGQMPPSPSTSSRLDISGAEDGFVPAEDIDHRDARERVGRLGEGGGGGGPVGLVLAKNVGGEQGHAVPHRQTDEAQTLVEDRNLAAL